MGAKFGNQFHAFVVLATVVIVALDNLSRQTILAQLIGGLLALVMVVAYIVSIREREQQE